MFSLKQYFQFAIMNGNFEALEEFEKVKAPLNKTLDCQAASAIQGSCTEANSISGGKQSIDFIFAKKLAFPLTIYDLYHLTSENKEVKFLAK